MKIPYFKAKDKDSEDYYEGFYFEYPETTYCFKEDYEVGKPVRMIPCLVSHRMSDWELPNVPQLITIDRDTLEHVGYIETDRELYYPNGYVLSKE